MRRHCVGTRAGSDALEGFADAKFAYPWLITKQQLTSRQGVLNQQAMCSNSGLAGHVGG